MITIASVSDDPTAQEVLRAWLNDRPAYFASAEPGWHRKPQPTFIVAGSVVRVTSVPDTAPRRRERPFAEVWEENQWSVVNTTATSVYISAQTGDTPLLPVGSESSHLALGLKYVAHTAAWPR